MSKTLDEAIDIMAHDLYRTLKAEVNELDISGAAKTLVCLASLMAAAKTRMEQAEGEDVGDEITFVVTTVVAGVLQLAAKDPVMKPLMIKAARTRIDPERLPGRQDGR